MDEVVKEFNTTVISFINLLIGLNTEFTSDIKIYKGVAESFISQKPTFMIEQFTLHCLPFYKEIKMKNVDFFMKKDYDKSEDKINNFFKQNVKKSAKGDMLNALKIKSYMPTLSKDKQDLICEYMVLFADYSKCFYELYKMERGQ